MTLQSDPDSRDESMPPPLPEPVARSEEATVASPVATATAAHNADARVEAQAIAEICLLAGAAQRTAEFLAEGMTEAQVRRLLLEARAAQPEITSRITTDAASAHKPENSPVVAAVKKLATKE